MAVTKFTPQKLNCRAEVVSKVYHAGRQEKVKSEDVIKVYHVGRQEKGKSEDVTKFIMRGDKRKASLKTSQSLSCGETRERQV